MPAWILRHLQLEEPAQEVLVRAADVDQRPARSAANLEHVGLDVLADAIVLRRRLVGGAQDGLGLAEVQDDAGGFDTTDRAGDDLALAVGELVEEGLALGLAQALANDLAGDLSADTAEVRGLQLLVLDKIAEYGRGVVDLGVGDGPLGGLILDLGNDQASAVDAHLAAFGIEADVDVLVARRDTSIGALDGVLDRADELLARDTLLSIELQERADEVPTHASPSFPFFVLHRSQQNVGVTHVLGGQTSRRKVYHSVSPFPPVTGSKP